MLWALSLTLLVLWLLGMISSYTLGGVIHLFLLMSAAFAIAARATRKRVLGNDHQPANASSDSQKATPNPSDFRPAHPVTTIVPPKSATMFLSYRRDDSADVVGRIYDRLVQQFGDSNVFKDVDSIRLGVDFREHLQTAVGECEVLIAVIGPAWTDVVDHRGARRLDDDRDYVRIEIEAAFNRKIPVIPGTRSRRCSPPRGPAPWQPRSTRVSEWDSSPNGPRLPQRYGPINRRPPKIAVGGRLAAAAPNPMLIECESLTYRNKQITTGPRVSDLGAARGWRPCRAAWR